MRKIFYKEKLLTVHDKDLLKTLNNLGYLRKFKKGKLKCKFCNCIITFKNLHSFFPQSGDIKFVCEKYSCQWKLYDILRERRISI